MPSIYEEIFNHTSQFIGFMDLDGTLLEINDRALEFVGVTREEVLGEPIWETPWIASADAREQLRAVVNQSGEGRCIGRTIEVQGTDHTARVVVTVRPVTDDHGIVTGLIGEMGEVSPTDQPSIDCGSDDEDGSPLLVSYARGDDEPMSTALLNAFLALNVDPFEKDDTLQNSIETDALDGFAWERGAELEVRTRIWGFTVVMTPDEIRICGEPSRLRLQ